MAEVELRELKPDTYGEEKSSLHELAESERLREEVASPAYIGLFSFFIMGLGQLYNGQKRAAKVFFATQMCLLLYIGDYIFKGDVSLTVIDWTSPFTYGFFMSILAGGGFVVWLFNVYDAYTTAKFCEMIYDRTLPSMDEEEEELFASHLRMATFGTENTSGFNRKIAFGGIAVFVYSAAIFLLGSYFTESSSITLNDLRADIAANGNDAFSHLQLGELLLAGGSSAEASREFRKVTTLTNDPTWLCAAYTSLARIHKKMGDEEGAAEMLANAASVAAGKDIREAGLPNSISGHVDSASPTVVVENTVPVKTGLDTNTVRQKNDTSSGTHGVSESDHTDDSVEGSSKGLSSMEVDFAFDRIKTELSIGNVKVASAILDDLQGKGCDTPLFWAWKSKMFLASGDRLSASKAAARALVIEPLNPVALRVSLSLAIPSTNSQMLAALKKYVAVVPDDPSATVEVATLLHKSGAYADAYKIVSEQLARTPHSNSLMVMAFRIARDDGRMSQAYEAAKAIVSGGIQNVDVCYFLALEEEKRNNFEGALKQARALSVMESGKTEWLILQGRLLLKMKDYTGSVKAYENALAVNGRSVKANMGLAEAARAANNYDLALKHLRIASSLAPDNVDIGNEMGRLAIDMGDFNAAEDAFRRVLHVSGDSLDARYNLGFVLYSTQRYDEGISMLKQVYSLAPSYKDVAWYLGSLYKATGQNDEAVTAFRAVEHSSSHFNEANVQIQKLMAQQSVPPLATVNTTKPVKPVQAPVQPAETAGSTFVPVEKYAAILESAELAFRDGRNEEALRKYNEVLAVVPDHFRSLYQKGVLLCQLGKPEKAIPVLESVRKLVPANLDALMELGNAYADLGRYKEAIVQFEEAIRQDPKHLAARYNLGWLFEKLKNYDKAEEHYKAIIWFYPEYMKAYDSLGNLYFTQARYKEALEKFDKIISVDYDDVTIRFKAALTLLQLGQNDRAKRELLYLKSSLDREHPLYSKVNDYLGKLG